MIGRLKGTIEHREADGSVIVDVQGVGYEVFLPLGAAGRLVTEAGQPVSLHIHTHVREDAMTLFGFATADDRSAFRALLKVSSIGPKLALAILGVMNASELREAIARHDKAAFKGISGVGRKTIERLLVDLQDKLDFAADNTTGVRLRAVPAPPGSASDTVVGALIQMGYKRAEAEAAVGSAAAQADPQQGDEAVQGLLRAALSALS
ncbi:MAG: Holliday junction branch migration protein RuvA [Myxococcota bacterium]